MSHKHFEISAEEAAKDKAFLDDLNERKVERRIQRHTLQARITHAVAAIGCIYLCISGLFVFVPQLAQALGGTTIFVIRMTHRVIGVIYCGVPILSAIIKPKGCLHVFKGIFDRWDRDDIKWIILFMPYLFLAKWLHMPDQRDLKSGQRFADGAILFGAIIMGVSGMGLLLGTTVISMSASVYKVFLLVHDFGFLFMAVFGTAHIFLGAGIFMPYKGMYKVMFGDGTISEEDTVYHWGHWAREVFAGENPLVFERAISDEKLAWFESRRVEDAKEDAQKAKAKAARQLKVMEKELAKREAAAEKGAAS